MIESRVAGVVLPYTFVLVYTATVSQIVAPGVTFASPAGTKPNCLISVIEQPSRRVREKNLPRALLFRG